MKLIKFAVCQYRRKIKYQSPLGSLNWFIQFLLSGLRKLPTGLLNYSKDWGRGSFAIALCLAAILLYNAHELFPDGKVFFGVSIPYYQSWSIFAWCFFLSFNPILFCLAAIVSMPVRARILRRVFIGPIAYLSVQLLQVLPLENESGWTESIFAYIVAGVLTWSALHMVEKYILKVSFKERFDKAIYELVDHGAYQIDSKIVPLIRLYKVGMLSKDELLNAVLKVSEDMRRLSDKIRNYEKQLV